MCISVLFTMFFFLLLTYHVPDCRQDLRKHKLALQVRQAPPAADTGEQLSSTGILHHQVEPLDRLHHLIQAHYVGVSQLLHTRDFRGEKLL